MDHQPDAAIVLSERRALSEGEVGIVTMNRGTQRNPLDKDTIRELNLHVDDLLADPAVRAVIITGAAPAFSAGGDLRGYLDLYRSEPDFEAFLVAIRDLFEKLETSRLFSIAVNGVCVAGGFEMVLSCDLAVMARGARMGDAHMKFWQLPGGGGTQRLPRAVGTALAKRLLFTKQLLSAEECYQWGLVAQVSDPEQLIDDAVALADDVCAAPESTVLTLKGLLRTAETTPLDAGIDIEIARLVQYTSGVESDAYKGLLRFLGPDAAPVA
jgi:enoyl-CoA hydratase/carnithine racemase